MNDEERKAGIFTCRPERLIGEVLLLKRCIDFKQSEVKDVQVDVNI